MIDIGVVVITGYVNNADRDFRFGIKVTDADGVEHFLDADMDKLSIDDLENVRAQTERLIALKKRRSG